MNSQKNHCTITKNLLLFDLKEPNNGNKNKIRIEPNIATTPPNLSGIALKIA
jgi:hypothetical protein